MTRSNTVEEDIAIANRAWTESDVTASLAGIAAHFGDRGAPESMVMTQNVVLNPSPTEQVVAIDKGIRRFWRKHGARFELVWKGMSRQARRRLLLTVEPEMARHRNEESAYGQLLLLPELVVDELANEPERLVDILVKAVTEDLPGQYWHDASKVRGLIRQGKLDPDLSKRDFLAFLLGKDHVGKTMKVNRARVVECGDDETLDTMVRDGYAIEGPVFSHVLSRRQLLLQTLALLIDEMQKNVFGVNTPKKDKSIITKAMQCSRAGCTRTKWTLEDGRETALHPCSRCRASAYCSKDCQRADWPEHRMVCGRNTESNETNVD